MAFNIHGIFGNDYNLSEIELLQGQVYKPSLWQTIFRPRWAFFLKLFIAWLLSMLISLIPVLSELSIYISYISVEFISYNLFTTWHRRP